MLDVVSPEGQSFGPKQEGFSHEQLVMTAYRKCIECLSKEMRQGHTEVVQDKNGKPLPVYLEDTRETSISSIETLKNVMIGDLQDTVFLNNIKDIYKQIETQRNIRINHEYQWWCALNRMQQQQVSSQGIVHIAGYFCKKLPYAEAFLQDKILLYRNIFEQLELCLASKRYFKKRSVGNRIGIVPDAYD